MLRARAAGGFSRRLLVGGAVGIVVMAVIAGAADGCSSTGNICAPDLYPNDVAPPDCYGPCTDSGIACMLYSDCPSGSCVDGVCACIPNGGKCNDFCECCGKACTGGVCEGGDASTDGPLDACSGVCLESQPGGWDVPSLVWIGAEPNAPPCPDTASGLQYEGRADPTAPIVCGTCTCGGPTGSCSLPTTITASSTACPATDPSTVDTPFDPPSGWDQRRGGRWPAL
jgi:hypothetical protein